MRCFSRRITSTWTCGFLILLLSLIVPPISLAQEFTATSLGDYGNVTVMEVTGAYDAPTLTGTPESTRPRQAIAKEFLRTHKDEYDFLVIFTNFDFQMPEKEAEAFYMPAKNDIQGIGQDLFDNTQLYDSNGRLQGTIDMGNLSSKATDPLDPKFEETLSVLSHEAMHRWAAFIKFKDSGGSISSALLGHFDSHWSFLLDTAGSLMYGNRWQDNGNGTFTSLAPQSELKYYSPLDRYLMGMIDKSKVPPMLLINSPDTDPSQFPRAGVTVTGTAQYVTIDQIIAAMGPRVPDAASSQKSFKAAFIFATRPGTFRGDEVYGIENVRNGSITRFSILTDGQAILQAAPTLQDTVAVNPGVLPPSTTPRTLPPNINDGVAWLAANQRTDGSWKDLPETVCRDTALAVQALGNFSSSLQNYQAGIQWLAGAALNNTDYAARQIEALIGAGQDTSALVTGLRSLQNSDGGWGSSRAYLSNPLDTALALKAMTAGGLDPQGPIATSALGYLKAKQAADGGWSGDDGGSTIQATAAVLSVFNAYRNNVPAEDRIQSGTAFLLSKQNADGGFGNSPSTVYDTAAAVLVLQELGATSANANALAYLLSRQSGDGSWDESSFQTALAIGAIYKASVDPDLSIKPNDISFIPAAITSLPANMVINANVWNLGMTEVPQANVVLYNGDPALGKKLGEQTVAFPGQAATTVTFSVALAEGGDYRLTIVLDPDNLIKESNKLNNRSAKTLTIEPTYDFEILPQNIAVSANPANMLQDVQLTAQIANRGTMNAYNVQVRYFIDDPAAPFEIATKTVDIPAGATVTSQATWRANRAGVNMPLAVLADPFNTFTELSKTNNKSSTMITVNASTTPNLSVSYKDLSITPAPVNQGGNASIAIRVKNDGFSPASNVTVNFHEGIPGLDGALLGSRILPVVAPGGSVEASITWTQIPHAGEKIVYVQVDPDNQIQELRKDDNDTFITVDILSLPDLAISTNAIVVLPPTPKDGDPVTIAVTVQNKGDQTASNVAVRLSEGEIVLGNPTIPVLAGNSTGTVSLSYNTTGKKGAHTITALVDPANAIAEQRKDNNTASRTFGVQDANLWLTEPYFSPNGDGVKDATRLFFKLDAFRTVMVSVVNEKSETVRTFSGPELANITEGNVIWDGLNDAGTVVRDGTYTFRINDASNAILGTLPVTMDTNRSPLSDAFGTKYLLNDNLTCMLPSLSEGSNWNWLPDESGMLLSVPYDQNTPEYPSGLYVLSPDGQDIQRIVPPLWTEGTPASDCGQRPVDNPCTRYTYPVTGISPDSEQVAFILGREAFELDPYYWWWRRWTLKENQLWVTNRYGKNLVMLDSYDEASQTSILDLSWSPLGNALAYRVQKTNSEELWYALKDGSGKMMLDSGGHYNFTYLRWSSDGARLAYTAGSYDANGAYSERIRITDLAGNNKDVFTVTDPSDPNTYSRSTEYLEWLGDQKLLLAEGGWYNHLLWLVDAGGNGNPVSVSEQSVSSTIVVAPNRQSFAFAEKNYSWAGPTGSMTTKVSDAGGKIVALHSLVSDGQSCEPWQGRGVWSPDSKKIVLSEQVTSCGDCGACENPIGPRAAIVDVSANKDATYDSALQPLAWLSDGQSIAGTLYQAVDPYGLSLCVMSTQNGDIRCTPMDPNAWLPSDARHIVSPRERYFTYYQYVDQSSVCYGRAYSNLWAMSSLLNLTTDLRLTPAKSAITLKGIAADLNFDSYQLAYADAKTPTVWNPVAPPSNVPVLNDVFTTWIPPYEGTFSVRVTAQDKAGNTDVSRKRVSWGLSSSITNIYKTLDVISPNNDGVKDTVELHYTVLEPVHLELQVRDESGALVRTYPKDHPAPVSDFIVWDGTDGSGRVVPDGKYSIRVFDYEFFFTVDATPPQVAASLGSIAKDKESGFLFAVVKGYVIDKNLKNWTLEYGYGENPQEWHISQQGNTQVAKRDANGVLIYDPTPETTVAEFVEEGVANFRGAKLRLTAEDHAGNRSTAITDMLEERIIFDRYVAFGEIILSSAQLDAELLFMGDVGKHTVGGLDTVRTPLSTRNVQYWRQRATGWTDAAVDDHPASGMFRTEWINPGVPVSYLRIKDVDTLGNEHYSNVIQTIYAFGINICKREGYNDLFEELKTLKLQISSSDDPHYGVARDLLVFVAPNVPKAIPIELPRDLMEDKHYTFSMIGIGMSGQVHTASAIYPPVDCVKDEISITVGVKPQDAECGLAPGATNVTAESHIKNITSKLSLKSLKYVLQKPSGPELLRSFDLTRERWDGVTVNTQAYAEGSYPVRAVLSYTESAGAEPKETSAEGTMIVDRILPVSLITYPSGTTVRLCPLTQHGTKGDWYGIPVEGVATDNTAVSGYELYYGIGENPDTWFPADGLSRLGINDPTGRIGGKGDFKGRIGIWDVSKLKGGTYTLKLRVIDVAGNASCSYATFSFDSAIDVVITDRSSRVISPNGDGAFDTATVNYEIDKYATVDAKVYKAIPSSLTPAGYVLDATPVRTIAAGVRHLGGTASVLWDGMNNAGGAVPDGPYGVALSATDACGNTAQKWVLVEVDTTTPAVSIAYPQQGNPLGNIVEARGSAGDLHFQRYVLEVGEGGNPDIWGRIAISPVPVSAGMLGKWNTFGLQGTWTLRLTALDTAGNRAVTASVIDLGMRQNLIKDLSAAPRFFSPNNDNAADTTTVQYELTDACNVKIEFINALGELKRTATASAPSLGVYTFVWDGKDGSGAVVPDGIYTIKLTAVLASNASVSQTETNTVIVDATLPAIDITQPADGSYLRTDVTVTGAISDTNLKDYTLTNSGNGTSLALDSGNQSRLNYVFGTLSGLAEGSYTLTAKAGDLAGNTREKKVSYTIDRTPPVVKLDTPKDGEYYGANRNVTISGGIVEKNLDTFELRYGPGDAPVQWTDLVTGTSVTAYPPTFTWKVGKDDNVSDGVYLLSLFAKDKAGATGEAKAKITIDNTPPTVAIMSLHDGDYVRQAVEVKGTAFDQSLDKYTLDISEGQCASAYKWTQVKTGTASVQDSSFGTWQALPADGEYCLRLTALDKVGLTAEAKVNVKVDTHPPAAPVLSGKADARKNANLLWTANTEPDLAGYNLYRAGQKVNTALLTDISYLDQNLAEGTYAYTVKAQDRAGGESLASNEVKIKIDLTGPSARISAPQDGARVSGLIDVKGTAYSADDFKQYRLSVGQGAMPSSWMLLRTSPLPVSYGALAPWDTLGLAEGQFYSLKLEAEDLSGNITTHQVSVTIDNIPPAAPILLSASAVASDVTVTWRVNTEADLAGYLLYRNDQLANVAGMVIGNLQPYLIKDTTYADAGRPDGTFRYSLVAVDQAGNVSNPSNALEVTIDTHPPHAAIVDPQDQSAFETTTLVKAESPDLDIASVQFQYQSIQSSPTVTADWRPVGSAVTSATLATYLDPVALGLVYGDYRLRAVATDKGNKADPTPGFITVTYTDLTPPAVPTGVTTLVTGGTATITWNANTEGDLDGYNIYRTAAGSRTKVNTTLVKAAQQPWYLDSGLADDTYLYEVTAVDTHNNESKPSGPARARIYAPVITQPYTPVGQSAIPVQGTNATANATVSLSAETASGLISLGTATADPAGTFTIPAALTLGENWLSARATDSAGNISKDSSMVVVVYDVAPGAPANAAAAVNGPDVHLTWDAEPAVLGYNVFRNGVKLNGSNALDSSPATIIASSWIDPWYDFYMPFRAVDKSLDSYWMPENGASVGNPVWWEMDLPSPELISNVELHWGADVDASGTPLLYAGKDYEVQVWSGYAWITQAKVTGNAVKDNLIDFKPAYRTDRIRIFITDSTDAGGAKQLRLAEVSFVKDNPVIIPTGSQPSYDDLGLLNKSYGYTLTAVDAYGFESLPTSTVSAVVNATLPSVPALTATAMNSDVILSWAAGPDPGIASYNVYKNTSQGWTKIGSAPSLATTYLDAALPNGNYTYRITVVDGIGNESLPSNEAAATVSVAPPAQVVTLSVTPTPEGGLSAAWVSSGSPVAGYNLYRGLTTGGPYARINSGLIDRTNYLDAVLTSGATYFYVVTAVDPVGNEGPYSNEASGTPSITAVPSKPVLFFPTVAGLPVTLFTNATDISGSAAPGSTVLLMNNGLSVGTAAALPNDNVQSAPVDFDGNAAAISPDGKTLAYTSNGAILLKMLATGTVRRMEPGSPNYSTVWSIVWSPDGRTIAYTLHYIENYTWVTRIYILDVESGATTLLTNTSVQVNENSPSWSPDGRSVAYTTDDLQSPGIFIKNLATGETTQVISTSSAGSVQFSPDGKTLAYFNSSSLYLYDLASGANRLIDDNADGYALAWSPDGTVLAFVSYRNGSGDVYVLNTSSGDQVLVPGSSPYPYYLSWTADGGYVLFGIWDSTSNRDTLWKADNRRQSQPDRIMPDLRYVSYYTGVRSGAIAVIDQNDQGGSTARLLNSAGNFSLSAVSLVPGENIFTATASNSAGNVSDPADAISVTFNASRMPELAVSADDVFLYPPYPIAGEQMTVNAIVWNNGLRDVSNVDILMYAWNAKGQLEMLASQTVPTISAGSSALITSAWNSTGKAGSNRLVVVVDPDNAIAEANESNNMAIKEFHVADHAGMFLNAITDFPQYSSSRDVNITVMAWNTGPAANAALAVQVEDANSYPVATFDGRQLSLAYAVESSQRYAWNTGTTIAGPYVVRAVLKDASGNTLAEQMTPFTIASDAADDLSVSTDKLAYGPQQNVVTSFSIRNTGTNSLIPALQAKVSITNAAGAVLSSEARTAINILPGASVDLSALWNTGLNVPGRYTATVEASFAGGQTVTRSAAFTIQGTVVLTGSMTASPSVVAFGSSTEISYVLGNTGNLDAQGYTLRVAVIDPATQTVMQTLDRNADIAANTATNGQFTVSTSGYGLKTYAAVLQAVSQGTAKTIASTSFAVKDLAPPVVMVASPAANSTNNATIVLSAFASDDVSGVGRVEYQFDNEAWSLLAVVDPSQARYGTSWEPTVADNGPHTVRFRATDKAGNTSLPVLVNFAVQISSAAPTAVITGTPSSPTNVTDATLLVGGADVVAYRYTVDAGAYSAEATIATPITLSGLSDGDHTVRVVGRNAAGIWQTEAQATMTTWTVDITPPVLAISALADGSITNSRTLNIAGTATDNIAVQGVTINGTAVLLNPGGTFSQAVTLAAGTNTITTIAVDPAGNTATDIRTITLDQTAPEITIITPADNSVVSSPAVTVSGTTDKTSTVLISVNSGPTATAATNAANFSLPVTLASNTVNTIVVYATDLAGNTGTAKRTVTHDDISPALAVTAPAQDITTNQAGILLRGTVADVGATTVMVTLDGTTYAPAITNGSFEQQLTFAEEKQYQAVVTATDAAGNSTTVQRNIIYDKTPPGLTVDPVKTPTNIGQQAVTGTRELNSTVTATCPTASVGVVSTPTPTTWQVIIADMTEGENVLNVTAADQAGNTSLPVSATIVLDSHAPDTNIISDPGLLTNVTSALFTFTATEPGCTFECLLDNGAFSACVSPLQYANLTDGTHVFRVRAADPAGNTDPAPAVHTWNVDAIPPVAVITGMPSSPTNQRSALLTVSGADVIAYKFLVDGSAYSTETAATTPIILSGLLDGLHTVLVIGKDSVGNWQPEVYASTAAWTIDITPPALGLSTLPDGSYTNIPVLNVAGTTSDTYGIQSVVVSGQTVTPATTDNVHYTFSQAVSLVTGTNMLSATATDNAGNTTVDTRTIILDQTAPVITVIAPSDNSVVNDPRISVSGTTDAAATVLISLNSGPTVTAAVNATTFSLPVTLATNTVNSIVVYATDLAGNPGTAKRTVTHDDTNPALAITVPNQDMGTNQTGITVSGTVSDLTAVSLLVTCPTASVGVVSTPTSTTWSVDLSNLQQGTNTVTVKATDGAGNSTTVVRNIILTQTPVSIDPVKTPTNSSQQLVTGTRELNATVAVNCSSATIGMIDYPTPTTWEVIIAGMAEGVNNISATATDLEGHISDPAAAAIVLDTHAPTTTPSPAPGTYYNGLTATLMVNEPSTIYFTTDGSTPTVSSATYSGPLVFTSSTNLAFFAVDLAGNPEPVRSVTYTIIPDTAPPVTTISAGSPSYISGNGTLFVTSASLFSLAATDDVSGVRTTAYRLDMGTGTAYASPFSLVSDGSHTIGYRSIDNASNSEQEKSLGVAVDNAPPVSSITIGGPPVTPSTAITIAAADNASGVRLTEYAVDGGAWTTYSGSFTLAAYSQGTHTITYRSTDNLGNVESPKTRSVQLWTERPTITTTALNDGTAGSAYSQTLTAAGGTAPYLWSVMTGTLPAGLQLNATTGTISGTPLSAGTATITFQAADVNAMTGTRVLSLTVYAPISVLTSALASGVTGTPYNQVLAATGGKAPSAWSISAGSLPSGLSLNSTTGVISGTPVSAGTSTFTVQVKDANNATATKPLSIAVLSPLTISTVSLPTGTTGTAYSRTLAATGGLQPYVWSLTTGTLPAGLTLNSSTGVIAGIPTSAGTSTFTAQVRDANSTTSSKVLSIVISSAQSFPQNLGVFGATGVTMSAGYIDSYDSTLGAYNGLHGSNVSVGTNSAANGAITLSGGVVIYGNAYVGPGGDPAKVITTSGGAVINGVKGALSRLKNMTPMSDPGGGTAVSIVNGTTLTSGAYRASSINLSGSGKATINGTVTLSVTGSVNLSGSAQIVILPGSSLTLYLNGSFNISGGSIVNQTLNPHNLTIYGTSTCTSANYSGTSALYAVFYAPAARTSISGGVNLYGSVIGASIALSGGSAIHYDVSLGTIGN